MNLINFPSYNMVNIMLKQAIDYIVSIIDNAVKNYTRKKIEQT